MRRTIGAAGAAVLLLTGCQTTTYSCSNDDCSVSLEGEGASTDLYDDELTVTLHHTEGGEATLDVGGKELTCAEGDTQTVAGVSVTCTDIADGSVDLDISAAR